LKRDVLSYEIARYGSTSVVELIRYAFENTAETENENDVGELRGLVIGSQRVGQKHFWDVLISEHW
jgi:hypothetical protein